jgi:hypothetical protein
LSRSRALLSLIRPRFLRLFGHGGEQKPDGHPTPGQLADYHEDRLPPEKEEEIQEHFVECPECPDLMLDLDRFASKQMPVLAVDDLSDTRVDRAWLRLRKRLFSDVTVTVPRLPLPQWLERPTLAWGMVCALLLCSAGLGLRVQSLRSELRAQQAPQLNPPFALVPVPPTTRSVSTVPIRAELEVPPDAPRFLLMLDSPDVEELPEYRLEIRTSLGEGVWEAKGLTLNEDGRFVVGLSRGFLPAGEYNIYVFGVMQGSEGLIQDYRVRFSYL